VTHFPLGYIAECSLVGKSRAAHITGILHAKYRFTDFRPLTARTVSPDPTGQIDFGGGEYVPRTMKLRRSRYGSTTNICGGLERGVVVQCNEALHLDDEMPDERGPAVARSASHVRVVRTYRR